MKKWIFKSQREAGVGCVAMQLCWMAVMLAGTAMAAGPKPDFGPNVVVFDAKMPATAMQEEIDKAMRKVLAHNEFGVERNAFLFLPGEYKLDVPVGFYTQVLGLGATPDAVHITGNVHADAAARNDNATTTFWRAAEGFSVTPTGGTMQWAICRRRSRFGGMHVLGSKWC